MLITDINEETMCKRCGLCCHLIINGKVSNKRCKHLIRLRNGKYICRVYKDRLYNDIGHKNVCLPRKFSKYDYEGCPYNTGGKPVVYKDENGDINVRDC